MKPLRILVFSASFGAGHLKAAEAMIEVIQSVEPTAEIVHEDFMMLINKTLNHLIRASYIELIKRAPVIWGKFYNGTKQLSEDSLIQRFLNTLGRTRFIEYIQRLKPDVIVCTYPTVAGILAQLRLKGELHIPLVTVITDYTVHSQWIHPGVDLYIVGSIKIYEGLVERGIAPHCIQVTGIPVNQRFEHKSDRKKILAELGLDTKRMTFLIMGGAYGVLGHVKWMCKVITMSHVSLQVIVVCGKDNKLFRSLDSVVDEAQNPILRFKFVDNVNELMTAADIIITKAGGLTVTEALTKHLPMIIYKPIPGQEESNAAFIHEIGAGRIARTDEEFVLILDELIHAPSELKRMSYASARSFPEQSALRAVEGILELANHCSFSAINKSKHELLHISYN